MKATFKALVATLLAFLLIACGGGSSGPTNTIAAYLLTNASDTQAVKYADYPLTNGSIGAPPGRYRFLAIVNIANSTTSSGNLGLSCVVGSNTLIFNSPSSFSSQATSFGQTATATLTIDLPAGATCNAIGAVASSGPGGTTSTPFALGFSTASQVSFTERILTVYTSTKIIGLVTPTGILPVTPSSGSVSNCGIYDKLSSDGRPLLNCVYSNPAVTRVVVATDFVYNMDNTMSQYFLAVPSGATLRSTVYGTFGDTPYVARGITNKGMYVNSDDGGVYYFTGTDQVNLRVTRDSFVSSQVIASDTYQILVRCSNSSAAIGCN